MGNDVSTSDQPFLHPTRIDMPLEIRAYVITLLQQTLACTVDLRSQVKQATWNVKGTDVFPLQALFTTIAAELDDYTDLVAARIAALGGVVAGHGTYGRRSVDAARVSRGHLLQAQRMCGHWRSASHTMLRRYGPTLRTPRMSRMRARPIFTPTFRVGLRHGSGSWTRISPSKGTDENYSVA